MTISYINTIPAKREFHHLYETTGWNNRFNFTQDELHHALCNSWYMISAYDNEMLVGFGRLISDGIYQTLLCDMIIHPNYQRRGIGREILDLLEEKCKQENIKWIQLSCAKGKVGFYKTLGFEERPADGPGMQKFLR